MLPEDYTSIHGWCTIEKAHKLIEIATELHPNLIVELGVFGGRSLLALALAVKESGCKVVGIDAWEKTASLEGENSKENDQWWGNLDYDAIFTYAKNLMKKHNVHKNTELWKAKSAEVVSRFDDESIDILHQDSNHSEKISCQEVELYWNKVSKNGVWIFDDVNWDTTKKAQELLVEKGYEEIYMSPATASSSAWKVFRRI